MRTFSNSGREAHQVVRLLNLGEFPVVYFFDADANDLAVSKITNSYFHETNTKEEYNQLGQIGFEKQLFTLIKEDLLKRKTEEQWAAIAYEKVSSKTR